MDPFVFAQLLLLSATPPLDVKDEAPGPEKHASATRPISPQP